MNDDAEKTFEDNLKYLKMTAEAKRRLDAIRTLVSLDNDWFEWPIARKQNLLRISGDLLAETNASLDLVIRAWTGGGSYKDF